MDCPPALAVIYCRLETVTVEPLLETNEMWNLDTDRTVYKVYNGWWYVGRPTVEELRMDLRALMSRRPDWEYTKNWKL